MRLFRFVATAAALAGLYYFFTSQPRRREAEIADDGRPVADDVLVQRVRTRLNHAFPRAEIDVRANHSVVMLRGTVTHAQRDQALQAVLAVPGVTRVANYLEATGRPNDGLEEEEQFRAQPLVN